MIRVAVHVSGIVQGVGFRPFVYDAATRRGLAGWVANRSDGVCLEVEGERTAVDEFLATLGRDAPPAAEVGRIDVAELAPAGLERFRIVASATGTAPRAVLPADLAICDACRAELRDPTARRHRYPFTNCTRCGPRYTVIAGLPYDRRRTTMRGFAPCAACAGEYADPADRRFHAEPIACPACGPVARLVDPDGVERACGHEAVRAAARALVAGRVVALKGLGGFQLLVDATDAAAVARLRARKHRPDKPFAVLFAALAALRAACDPTPAEEAALASPAAPIVLVRRRRSAGAVVDGVAPGTPWIGALLPTTPLHLLVADAVGRPLVCTSGNLTDDPICIDDDEARTRLGAVADVFLVHDRPIVRPVDDSVARVGPQGLVLLRRARGFAPLPVRLAAGRGAPTVLALGAHQKSTIALSVGGEVVVSQHLGDLHGVEASALLERTVADLLGLFAVRPARVACDLHPDYASTRLARRLADAWRVPLEGVQHHHAHVAAVMAEHGLERPVLGLAWDGVGLGTDGALWGGEALRVDGAGCERVGHLRPFRLPGGGRALREPRRAALGVLHALGGSDALAAIAPLFTAGELRVLIAVLGSGAHAPATTSIGRLFDAVAALLGLGAVTTYEGQAAAAVEIAADEVPGAAPYPLPIGGGLPAVADWRPLIAALVDDRRRGVPVAVSAARFHAALADLAAAWAVRAGLPDVVLGGGCFQNVRLTTLVRDRLAAAGFTVWVAERHPPNDGAIALGQALVAIRRAHEESHVSRHSG